ncbi:DNA-3-methyladenine glycosylase I [Gilvimarinus polysaccharolyticus]|uniref:DNA-3-methyladenine glycosylase I n=1 Tax=Gilvimarinus polysaccharolyticus TaxID=863921 RepID=UPI0006732DF0|nr:DNA-3-methyladenine glycosylase I [Gilvimarinus polysaccharolyticus]
MSNTPARCQWCSNDSTYQRYHDQQWGVPCYNARELFEMLILEGAQAGLSWITVLKKREGYRAAFCGFDPIKIAQFTEQDVERLRQTPAIIRNKLKIESAIKAARAYLAMQEAGEDWVTYLWSFVGGQPIQNHWRNLSEVPVTTAESDAMSKSLKKKGFNFVGSTICYAFMQATGMVNDHTIDCFRHQPCSVLAGQHR